MADIIHQRVFQKSSNLDIDRRNQVDAFIHQLESSMMHAREPPVNQAVDLIQSHNSSEIPVQRPVRSEVSSTTRQ